METFKVLVGGKEVELSLRNPKGEDVREADKIKSIAYNDALYNQKMPLASQAREEAIKRKIWNEEKQLQLMNYEKELIESERLLTKDRTLKLGGPGNDDPNTMFNIALKCQELREKIARLKTIFSEMESKTVEGYSENERLNYLIYATTVYKDSGTRFFESFDDFKNATFYTEDNSEKNNVAIMAYAQYQLKLFGEYQKSADTNPENKFLKRFKFVDDKGRFLNKDGKLVNLSGQVVDEDGNLLNIKVEEEEPKPYLDDEGKPILDEEYLKELEEYNKRNKKE
jgi:hypothetical protein